MATAQRMIKNLYRDSVSLMHFSEKLRALDGIEQASAVMATENNISPLVEAGLPASAVPPLQTHKCLFSFCVRVVMNRQISQTH